ncbi:uncharacterized protein LOC121375894 [Gigantopelta aegis]|uniref:uncharacterized protein LOC121375894 n=1 Tax=Gigantopelta aegis TaxID=1735272 RepID=UPI001B88ADC7|nr:uncharacterized protein LOC121375894 [Gigantopelta aegis]
MTTAERISTSQKTTKSSVMSLSRSSTSVMPNSELSHSDLVSAHRQFRRQPDSRQSQATSDSALAVSTRARILMQEISFELKHYRVLKPLRKTEPIYRNNLPSLEALQTEKIINEFEQTKRNHPDDVKYKEMLDTVTNYLEFTKHKPETDQLRIKASVHNSRV